jgi:hypothetical protein
MANNSDKSFPLTQNLRLQPGLFVYFEVAKDIGEQRNYSESQKAQFTQDMLNAIAKGQLPTRNSVGTMLHSPCEDVLQHLVHPRDLNCWLESRSDDFQWTPPKAQTPAPAPAKVIPHHWRHQVQIEATEHWIRLRASNANPSVNGICEWMAKWCIENDIKGGKNQNPRAGTLRNTVLGAGHWTPPNLTVQQAKEHVARIAQTKAAQTAQ